MSVSAIGQNAYASAGMSLSADCSGSSCAISGDTDRSDQDATMVVTASNGNKVTIGQLDTSGGHYSTSLNVSALDDGTYAIAVNQGSSSKYSLSVNIDVSGGSSSSSASVSNMVAESEEEAAAESASSSGLQLTAGGMEGSTTIDVSGTTDRGGDITLTVTAPNGNIITVSQISPSSGSFATTIETGGPLWSQDGMYSIKAVQGAASSHQKTAQVEVIDGHVIPEFGVIAAMILAVAIVSIIVVTAKTKLSLVPRY
jgi:predicted secreted protein with PEFG-CTERM motif